MKIWTMRANVCTGLALLAGAAFGQAPAAPAFEVASIKPAPPPTPGIMKVEMGGDPGMVDYRNASLKAVIARAYGMKEYQVSGPDWLGSERFDILAKVPANTPASQIPLMLKNLLEVRFGMAAHREQKVMPVYAMVVGKSGFKLKPLENPGESRMNNSFSPKGRRLTAQTTVTGLAGALSQMLDRPVLDQSGVAGSYDIDLEWVPDEREGGGAMAKMKGMAEAASGDPHGDPSGPTGQSLFGALDERLGLKVEARKSAVDILIVDAARKVPTEN